MGSLKCGVFSTLFAWRFFDALRCSTPKEAALLQQIVALVSRVGLDRSNYLSAVPNVGRLKKGFMRINCCLVRDREWSLLGGQTVAALVVEPYSF